MRPPRPPHPPLTRLLVAMVHYDACPACRLQCGVAYNTAYFSGGNKMPDILAADPFHFVARLLDGPYKNTKRENRRILETLPITIVVPTNLGARLL